MAQVMNRTAPAPTRKTPAQGQYEDLPMISRPVYKPHYHDGFQVRVNTKIVNGEPVETFLLGIFDRTKSGFGFCEMYLATTDCPFVVDDAGIPVVDEKGEGTYISSMIPVGSMELKTSHAGLEYLWGPVLGYEGIFYWNTKNPEKDYYGSLKLKQRKSNPQVGNAPNASVPNRISTQTNPASAPAPTQEGTEQKIPF